LDERGNIISFKKIDGFYMSLKLKNRHRLKKKEIKNLQQQIKEAFNLDIELGSSVDVGEIDGTSLVLIDDIPCFTYFNKTVIFTLQGIYKYKPSRKYVTVDMGAIKFVTNGADVMAPGIIDADVSISEDDQVWICDETHHKPLASGIALMSGEQMIEEQKGKAVRVLHYIGDSLWESTN
jgi:PUA domain protein